MLSTINLIFFTTASNHHNIRPHPVTLTSTMALLPPPEAIYADPETAFIAIQAHAKDQGYAFKKRDKKGSRIVFTCDRGGKYDAKGRDPAVHKSKQRASTGSKKCGCLMMVELRLDHLSGNWILKVLEGAHNHVAVTHVTAHSVHRNSALTTEVRAQIDILSQSGLNPSQILTILRKTTPEIPLIAKDISNVIQEARLTELSGRTPIQWLLDVRYLYPFDYFTNLYTL